MGPHLHFGLGSPTVSTPNTKNPILEGLKQPLYGKLNIIEDGMSGQKINLLRTGPDGTFTGENDRYQVIKPGDPVRAIIRAYHRSNGLDSNPYKIIFDVENLTEPSWPKVSKEIVFDNMAKILSKYDTDDGYYCFSQPFVTYYSSETNYADYYFVKFYPIAGRYKITAKIYSCYRDNSGFHLSEPETAEREITVGVNGEEIGDMDFYDPNVSFAWLPNDIAGGGAIVAAATPIGGIRAAAVAPEGPKIFYAFANNNIITTNLLDVDQNHQKNVIIESRTKNVSNWTIRLFNSTGTKVDEKIVNSKDWLRLEWAPSVPAGEYSFNVTARDLTTGGVSTYESYNTINIDNTKPLPLISMLNNSVSAPDQKISAKIKPSEDLYSIIVNVVSNKDYSMVQERIYTSPSGKKDQEEIVEWEEAYAYPDGFYNYEIIMTDLAGNISKNYSPIMSINRSGSYIPPPPNETYNPSLPAPPPWTERPKVSDIALDSSGNQYVLYGRYNKIVKYNSSGEKLLEKTDFGGTPLFIPLGLCVSDGKIYISDSYNVRVLVCDSDLNLVREIKGQDAYVNYGDIDTYEWLFGVKTFNYSNDAGGGMQKYSYEGFGLPSGIAEHGGILYVADKSKHRLLKYDKDGVASIYTFLKADLKDEARAAFNRTDYVLGFSVSGRTVDKAIVYSNALNDNIVFDPNAIDRSLYNRGWISHLFLQSNQPGKSDGQLSYPESVAADTDSIFMADTSNNRIQKYRSDGTFISKIAEDRLTTPKGIAVDDYGNVWVADTGSHRIVEFNAVGDFIKEFKSDEYEINPQKIAVKNGKVYIADANFDKPLIWNVAGTLSDIRLFDEWFSPNNDNVKDTSNITYSISQPASITIQVINTAGEVVGSVLDKAPRDLGTHKETWNGQITTASGAQLTADGNYLIKVIAHFGDYLKSKTAEIHVDTRAPTLTLSASERAISPNSDSIKDTTQFVYQVNDNLAPRVTSNFLQYKNDKQVNILWDDSVWDKNGKLGERMASVWNGKIGAVQAVSQGKYINELKAVDLAGNTAFATCEVIVDITPPRIENASIDNPYFSPNNDRRKDVANIAFYLNDNIFNEVKLTAKIADSAGKEILILKNEEALSRGEQSIAWDGFTTPGSPESLVSDGPYKLKFWARDDAGNTGTIDLIEVIVDTIPPEIRGLTANPNPFTPNDDGIKDNTAFNYTLSEPCSTNLKIFREDGVLFRSRGKYNITEDSYTWDGKGARGELLGGTYAYYLYAEDRAANISTSEAKTIIVDREPSLIPYCYAEPDPFSPANPRNNYTEIKYWVSRDNVQVQVAVLGREGQVIKNVVFGEIQNKGEHIARWIGDYVSGYNGPRSSRYDNRVADGAYEFKIWAYDPYNDARGENNNTVLVDNTPPYVALYPIAVDQVGKKAILRYYLPEKSKVDIAAYDAGGSLVERIITGEAQDAGEYLMPWEMGSRTLGRTYFTVAAEDSAKNRDEKTTEIFSINPEQSLTLTDLSASPNPFTPNSDGLKDQTRISYRLLGGVPEYRVNINILNSAGATVRRLAINEPQNQGAYNFYWDGQADSADPTIVTYASDGLYTYQIIAEDRLGGRVEAGGSFTLVSTKPTVNVSTNPVHISPNGDGIADTALIAYSIDYPVAWIADPALVKLDIVNASGEAVFSKTISQTAGTYNYTWNVRDGGDYGPRTSDVPAGTYYVFANALDALGTLAVPKSTLLYIDYTVPAPSNFSITPLYAKLGTTLSINLSFDEPLAENPTANIFLADESVRSVILETRSSSASPNDYWFSYTIGPDDPEGLATVQVSARDLSLNPILRTQTITIDKTDPIISNIIFSPNPAKVGNSYIDFKINESLSSAIVKVAQNGTDWTYATVSDLGSGNYRATHSVFPGYDGPASTTIEASDLAENLTTYQPIGLMIDTIAPTFSGISCEVNNSDFSKYSKEASEVTIDFRSSETLQFNPEVLVNSRLATYFSQIGNEYIYRYSVRNDDPEGLAEISISAYDPAGNLGEKSTNTETESFRIDLTNPTVAIAAPGSGDIIASPSPFFTNADPADASERPNYTTLRYETSEYGFVTLKVHKISNDLTTYTRNDFTEGNRAATLVVNQLMAGGVHNTEWRGETTVASFDANSDGYADPGKYAFIVEVRDRAGNITQRKWGGTVWIQNNVLQLIQPETIGINPDPLNFSPNITTGNSTNTTTKFWFKVKLGISPSAPADPERIEAMALPDDFRWLEGVVKKVGTYTVKVYDSTGNWIRTIEKDSPMYSATDSFVIWDGKNGTGADKLTPDTYVTDGDYKLVADIKDYAGNPAYGNLLERWVKADSTLPTITDNQPGDDTWRNGSGTPYNVDLSDSGSRLQDAYYKIRRPGGSETSWYQLTGVTTGTASYVSDWVIDWDNCFEGANYISVRSKDIAGNERTVDDIYYVKKDIARPYGNVTAIQINSGNAYTNNRSVTLALSASDPNGLNGSGVSHVKIWNDGVSEPADSSAVAYSASLSWTIRDLDGGRTVNIRFRDLAGNWSNDIYSDTITLDRTAPTISLVSDNPDPFSPGNADGNKDTLNILYSIDEAATSLVIRVDGATISSNSQSAGTYSYTYSPGSGISEGSHSYSISATDAAGNTRDWTGGSFIVDNTPPAGAPSSFMTTSGDGVVNLYWNYLSGADGYYIYRATTHNGTYSKISGFISGNSYQNTGLSNGTRYWYKIRSADNAWNEGNYSNPAGPTPGIISQTKVTYKDILAPGWDVYKANNDLSTPIRLTNDGISTPGFPNYYGGSTPYKWSSDGRILYVRFQWTIPYSGADFIYDNYIKIMNPDGSNQRTIVYLNSTDPDHTTIDIPIISPDGSKVVYEKQWSPGYSELWIVNSDGTGNRRLLGPSPYATYYLPVDFSYDGQKIFYNHNNYYGARTNAIFSVNIDGTGNQFILGNSSVYYNGVRISPDGTRMLINISGGGDPGLWQLHLFSYQLTKLSSETTTYGFGWRPDGIYFNAQKPVQCWSPFVPNMSSLSVVEKGANKAQALTNPILLEPNNGSIITNTIRPTFKWQGVQGVTDYRIQLNQTFDTFVNPTRTLSKTVTQTESNQAIAYAIHEFDDGLAAGQWYWRVLAVSGTQEAESDHWSFTIDPALSITGITNYPNPFNPNRERTAIRYRLGRDADEVKIRIYDITGALVNELEGSTQGESVNIWSKYNDIYWDGCNGRGDKVLNGIYPFEVVARVGDRSVSGRGKIAVLK